jgi:acetyltransferase-like isoleucine patch superfamily enzyme
MATSHPISRVHFEDPLNLVSRTLTYLFTKWVRLAYPFASLGRKVSIHYSCDLGNTGLIQMGDSVTVHKDVWLHAHPTPNRPPEPVLIIDDHCFIARRSHISARNRIHIEREVILAASVLIEDHSHAYDDPNLPIGEQGVNEGGRIRIGQGCWLGQNAAIICNSGELTLGRNCVVAANAVVTKSAPPYSVLSGNPARIVKQYDPVTQRWVLGAGAPVVSSARA